MPLYGKDAWNDEAFTALPWDAQGLFWRLAYWQWTEGSIPADVDRIIEIVGKPRTSRRLLADFLLKQSFFVNHPEKPGRLYNKTTDEHLQAMLIERDRKSIGAELTNAKRTAQRTGEVRLASGIPDATRDASANAIEVSFCKSEDAKKLTPQQEAVKRVVDALEEHTTGFLLPTGGLVARWLRDYAIEVILDTIAEQGKLGNLDGRDPSYLFRCIESHVRRPQSRTSGTRPALVPQIGAGPVATFDVEESDFLREPNPWTEVRDALGITISSRLISVEPNLWTVGVDSQRDKDEIRETYGAQIRRRLPSNVQVHLVAVRQWLKERKSA